MSRWSADDIPALDGRSAIVTGANSGLGYETALGLATHGADVVLACRDEERGADALDRIHQAAPSARVELRALDLADLSSVRAFAAGYASDRAGLDILVNNAGVMAIPYRQTADGFEMQFGTNHLGHFALTGLLLEPLRVRPGARVVTVSSIAANIGRIDFDDLHHTRRYSKWAAYGQAKLANQLFTIELDRRVREKGLELLSLAAHPGYAATNLQAVGARMAGQGLQEKVMELGNRLLGQSAADGALPSLHAATAPGVESGQYFGPDALFGSRGHPTSASFVRAARDPERARRLWEASEELTGVRFEV
jgi:NAD(P)-dependent dehydrogenase (short-subunit alcohol dehydrogenase family)